MDLKKYIDSFPDFPKPGILFRDISPLLNNPDAFREAISRMETYAKIKGATKIAGFDARGFVFGSALALQMGLPFIMLRKKGKLPGETVSIDYGLEYGTDRLEMRKGSVSAGDRVLLADDLLATGGTAKAGADIIEAAGATIVGLAVAIELADLKGRAVFGRDVHTLIRYENESDS